MAKKKETQIQILEVARGERELGVYKFCEHLGITGAWYYACLKNKRDPLSPKTLSELAVDQVGTWIGDLAVECIKLDDPRLVPCVCQTELGDCGPCPKHGDVTTFLEFLEGCDIDDLSKTVPLFSPEQKNIVRNFLKDRADKQLEAVKVQIHEEVGA